MQLKNKNIFSEKIINALLAATFFSVTIFFFAPLQIYLANRLEFPFLFSQVFRYFFLVSLFFVTFITLLLVTLNPVGYKKIITVLFTISFLLWLQGNIIIWNYGVFNGVDISWNKYFYRGLIDGCIWCLFILIAIAKSSLIYKIFRRPSLGIILIQFISLLFVMTQTSSLPSFTKYHIKTEDLYNFSSKRNVIILVLDAFQSDMFQEIINEDDSYKQVFRGFTYFRNALSGFPLTYPSVALILTGRYYDNSVPIQEFLKYEFLYRSLPKSLKDNGFKIELYPLFHNYSMYYDSSISPTFRKYRHNVNFAEDIAFIYDLALFRYTPHFFKQYIYNNQEWFLRQIFTHKKSKRLGFLADDKEPSQWRYMRSHNVQFFNKIESLSILYNDADVFKYIHLEGTHPPLLFNESVTYEPLPFDRQGYKKQAKGTLKIVKRFLEKLDEIGIFDSSMICIIGDHGTALDVRIPEDIYNKWPGRHIPINKQGHMLPLILLKPFKSRGNMQISDAPVSLSDIPRTIMAGLDLNSDFPGTSMFTIKDSDIRERRYIDYQWDSKLIKNDFLPVMEEYVISGFSWFGESWRKTKRKFKPAKATMYNLKHMWGRITGLLTEQ